MICLFSIWTRLNFMTKKPENSSEIFIKMIHQQLKRDFNKNSNLWWPRSSKHPSLTLSDENYTLILNYEHHVSLFLPLFLKWTRESSLRNYHKFEYWSLLTCEDSKFIKWNQTDPVLTPQISEALEVSRFDNIFPDDNENRRDERWQKFIDMIYISVPRTFSSKRLALSHRICLRKVKNRRVERVKMLSLPKPRSLFLLVSCSAAWQIFAFLTWYRFWQDNFAISNPSSWRDQS